MGRQKRIESTARPSRPEAPNFPLRLAEAAGSFLRTRFNNAVHRAAESEIARLCEFRRLALDVADVGTWEHNIRTNEVTGDERARAIFGAPSTHLSFEEVIECSHPDDREKVRQAVARVLQPGSQGNYEMEHRVIWPDGSIKWVSVKGRVFFSDPGRKYPARFIGTVTDISARKRAEEAVKKTRDELAEISANLERTVEERTARLRETLVELEKFSHALVHDMRAPLRAMESYASLLRDEIKPAASSRAEDYLERISNAARRLDLLILDALNYSQVLRGECPLAPVDLQSLIDQLIRSYPDFQPPKAEVRVEGELPVVQGTVAGLTQCFSNLLGNAVKFVGPGVQPKVVIYSEPVPAGFRVWIKDNGIGIPAESHERVFNLFQRLDNRYPGTGIGLAIVRKVAEQMQGAAGVESEPDKGSRFWIDLKPATANPISSVSFPAQV